MDVASLELLAVRSSKGGAKARVVGPRTQLQSWHAHKYTNVEVTHVYSRCSSNKF